ncbi:hypothetical protein XBJ2_2360039 [Xenorhabdus bovienii str. Jollieti]|uniref:Uncharacterized protein n=1 Tax=Xenorhabdus bovienii (strain SS-2004) TaxID=406818 RepID=D3UXY2_XENBS|nr:hypothetical protein XBJ1_0005 [Xenorhabdus bovienii SS-2004]CDH29221.1 hypothetical protein XBJ2_2360039 [Xenorhabdus bovienii str. Jollieti]
MVSLTTGINSLINLGLFLFIFILNMLSGGRVLKDFDLDRLLVDVL